MSIGSLHAAWCQASAQDLHPVATERIFYELDKLGFTDNDVTIVVEYLQAFNRKSGGAKFRINVVKLCGDPEFFASLVGEARAAFRNRVPAPTPKDKIIALRDPPAVEPTKSDPSPARPFSEVFAAMRKAAK